MPHELTESPDAVLVTVIAPSREELFRAALTGVLEAAYGGPSPEGSHDGHVVPVQAAGGEDDALLADLVDDTLRAIREEAGTLRPPRWLAFDEKRVTANLPRHSPRVPGRPLELSRTDVEAVDGGWAARLELVRPSES